MVNYRVVEKNKKIKIESPEKEIVSVFVTIWSVWVVQSINYILYIPLPQKIHTLYTPSHGKCTVPSASFLLSSKCSSTPTSTKVLPQRLPSYKIKSLYSYSFHLRKKKPRDLIWSLHNGSMTIFMLHHREWSGMTSRGQGISRIIVSRRANIVIESTREFPSTSHWL